jgi:hypothetical protein
LFIETQRDSLRHISPSSFGGLSLYFTGGGGASQCRAEGAREGLRPWNNGILERWKDEAEDGGLRLGEGKNQMTEDRGQRAAGPDGPSVVSGQWSVANDEFEAQGAGRKAHGRGWRQRPNS